MPPKRHSYSCCSKSHLPALDRPPLHRSFTSVKHLPLEYGITLRRYRYWALAYNRWASLILSFRSVTTEDMEVEADEPGTPASPKAESSSSSTVEAKPAAAITPTAPAASKPKPKAKAATANPEVSAKLPGVHFIPINKTQADKLRGPLQEDLRAIEKTYSIVAAVTEVKVTVSGLKVLVEKAAKEILYLLQSGARPPEGWHGVLPTLSLISEAELEAEAPAAPTTAPLAPPSIPRPPYRAMARPPAVARGPYSRAPYRGPATLISYAIRISGVPQRACVSDVVKFCARLGAPAVGGVRLFPEGPHRRQAIAYVGSVLAMQHALQWPVAELFGATVTIAPYIGVGPPPMGGPVPLGAAAAAAAAYPMPVTAPTAESCRYGPGTLIVGDGNFSFSAALAGILGTGDGIVATAYDREEDVRNKYYVNFIEQCRQTGMEVHFGVDATQMIRDTRVNGTQYRFIVFNFPHTDHQQTSDDAEEVEISIQANKLLLSSFFMQAKRLLTPDGEIHVTVKDRLLYRQWDIHKLASDRAVELVRVVPFRQEDWPGYDHVATRKGVSRKVDLLEAYTLCWALPGSQAPSPMARLYRCCHTQRWMLNEFNPMVDQILDGWSDADFQAFQAQYGEAKQNLGLLAAVQTFQPMGHAALPKPAARPPAKAAASLPSRPPILPAARPYAALRRPAPLLTIPASRPPGVPVNPYRPPPAYRPPAMAAAPTATAVSPKAGA